MKKIEVEKLPFSQIDQVGLVVRDIGKAIEHYSSLGIGPFESLNITLVDRKIYGKPADNTKHIVKVAQMGRVQLELIQHVAGESIHKEFLESKGEGVDHLCSFVDDFDGEVAKLVEKGFKVISSGRFVGGGG